MNQSTEGECGHGVCRVAKRSTSLPSALKNTRMEIKSTDLEPDLQGKQATRYLFGSKEDYGAAEKTFQSKDLEKKRRHSEPLYSAHTKAYDSSGSRLLLKKHNTKTFHKKDITAARAFFPDFFPQQPLPDSYDCLHPHTTLEQIFSGQIKSQSNDL